MNAPNRAREIEDIFDRLALPSEVKTEADTGRRQNLFTIVRELNQLDGGNWGVLQKTDQGNKIPGDVIVWKPTMEHFDVLLGSGGPAWTVHGVVGSDQWKWLAVDPVSGSFDEDVRRSLGRVETALGTNAVAGTPDSLTDLKTSLARTEARVEAALASIKDYRWTVTVPPDGKAHTFWLKRP